MITGQQIQDIAIAVDLRLQGVNLDACSQPAVGLDLHTAAAETAKSTDCSFTHQNTNGICFNFPVEQLMEKGKASHTYLEGRAKEDGKFSYLLVSVLSGINVILQEL